MVYNPEFSCILVLNKSRIMKYKILFLPSLLFLITVSCKKNNSSTDAQLPPPPTDTLTEGWKKIVINERPELFDIFL
jgi:hypothetical protein